MKALIFVTVLYFIVNSIEVRGEEKIELLFDKNEVGAVDIYFIHWTTSAGHGLSLDGVRTAADMKMSSSQELFVYDVADWLGTEKMVKIEDIKGFSCCGFNTKETEEEIVKAEGLKNIPVVKLIFDFQMLDGTTKTFFANQEWLFDSEAKFAKKLDNTIKMKFDFKTEAAYQKLDSQIERIRSNEELKKKYEEIKKKRARQAGLID